MDTKRCGSFSGHPSLSHDTIRAAPCSACCCPWTSLRDFQGSLAPIAKDNGQKSVHAKCLFGICVLLRRPAILKEQVFTLCRDTGAPGRHSSVLCWCYSSPTSTLHHLKASGAAGSGYDDQQRVIGHYQLCLFPEPSLPALRY